jgi:dihydrofolate reductase
MQIAIIAAMAENRVIGKENSLPWRLPEDLRHFRHLTLGKPVIMGRRTYESLGKPLPGRRNIVVTSNRHYVAGGCAIVHSLEQALEEVAEAPEVMIIGGATLYAEALPRAYRLYLTLVHQVFSGDVSFPEFDLSEWREVEREDHEPDDRNPVAFSFITLVRSSGRLLNTS